MLYLPLQRSIIFTCGIVGFTGRENALPILIKGLYSLEYRGYDSAGLAVRDGVNAMYGIGVCPHKGRVKFLKVF